MCTASKSQYGFIEINRWRSLANSEFDDIKCVAYYPAKRNVACLFRKKIDWNGIPVKGIRVQQDPTICRISQPWRDRLIANHYFATRRHHTSHFADSQLLVREQIEASKME